MKETNRMWLVRDESLISSRLATLISFHIILLKFTGTFFCKSKFERVCILFEIRKNCIVIKKQKILLKIKKL